MKKIYFHHIALFTSLLLASACQRELMPQGSNDKLVPDGETATFTFVPEFAGMPQTKGLAEKPQVKNIYFAVFDAAGYKLSEYAQAVPNSFATENWDPKDPSTVYSYSVELTVTDQPRIIHIIANAPETIPYGTEAEVIGSLNTSLDAKDTDDGYDSQDAYWDRVYLKDGVWPEPKSETQLTDPDYNAKRRKFLDVISILKEARLVRNFTRITLTNYDNKHFLATGFWLTNVPDIGSVAPYNRNTKKFQIDYRNYTSVEQLRGTGEGEGNYQGFMPAIAKIRKIDGTETDLDERMISLGASDEDQHNGNSAFCYEREIPKSDPLYIIVAGKYYSGTGTPDWNSIDDTYYKIDIRDNNDIYFPILRNFNYRVNIKEVHRSGASSIAAALSAAPSGEVDTSLDMQELTNISDGQSQMFVSETDMVVVGSDDVLLRYKFIPDLSVVDEHNYAVVCNDCLGNLDADKLTTIHSWTSETSASEINAIWSALSDNQKMVMFSETPELAREHVFAVIFPDSIPSTFPYKESYVTITRSAGSTGNVFSGYEVNAEDAESDSYREVTLTPVTPSGIIKNESVTITGHYWYSDGKGGYKENTITRVVNYHLREKLRMDLKCTPGKIATPSGQKVDVIIGIEAGLPSSIFSLNMEIEAAGLSITPDSGVEDNNLPVTTGTSTIASHSSAPAYWFTRTITWTEYQEAAPVNGYKYFTSSFITNKEVAESETFYVSNKYFEQAHTTISSYSPRSFASLVLNPTSLKVGETTTASFTIASSTDLPADNKILVGLDGFEPASVSGLSFCGTRTENGIRYEVYEMAATGNGEFNIVAFRKGDGNVCLWADEFTPITKTARIIDGDIKIYINTENSTTGSQWLTLTGANVTGNNRNGIAVGQPGTLCVYVAGSNLETDSVVKIGSTNATRANNKSITIDGEIYYMFTLAYTPTGSARIENFRVYVDGIAAGSAELSIYGIDRSTTALGNNAPRTDTWYIFYNVGRQGYAYNSESTLALNQTDNNYASLMKFSSNGSTTKVFNARANNYVSGTNGDFSFNDSGTSYTRSTNNNQMRLSYKSGNTTYYWRGTSNYATQMNTSTNNSHSNWNVYPVTIVAPKN